MEMDSKTVKNDQDCYWRQAVKNIITKKSSLKQKSSKNPWIKHYFIIKNIEIKNQKITANKR